ncbi:hypothetical protein [Micromonospora sp. DT47]|uniref:hypothetical protein n=1 Tax=Micromonospora sp. DT47 TaxID=3393431 RepID=UPI003CEEF7B3
MRLAAEMLRAHLPPLTFSTVSMTINGALEPSYDVGGDATVLLVRWHGPPG